MQRAWRVALPFIGLVIAATVAAGAAAQAPPGTWTPPVTASGGPDLTGMWPITHLNGTLVQRPAEFGERRFLTDEELARREAQIAATRQRTAGAWAEIGEPNRLTSLIVEPPDGGLPAPTAEGRRRSAVG